MDYYSIYINDLLQFSGDNFLLSICICFIFLLVYSTISLPGIIIFIAVAGYLFGTYYGFIISIVAITIGSFIFFLLSKFFFRYFFLNYYKKINLKINTYISESTIEYLIIFRIIPGSPLMLQNLILSMIEISYIKFLFATIIGFTPFIFTVVFIGNKIKDIQSIKSIATSDILSWDLLFVIFAVILIIVLRIRYKNLYNKKPSLK